MLGLFMLLLIAYALIVVTGTVVLIYGMSHPPRKTYATALAQGLPTDPAELSLSAAETTFHFKDRTSTPAWLIEGQNPDGPVVVIVHGFGDSRYGAMACWAPRVRRFASQVVVYDQRGQGEAQARMTSPGMRESEDVLTVIEQLPPGMVKAGVVLYGYSMGAGIAIDAAAASAHGDKHRIVGVIADGPCRYWDEPIRCFLKLQRLPAFPFVPLAELVTRVFVRGFHAYDRAKTAAKLSMPLLVLHGDADVFCDHDAGRAIAEVAPRGTFVSFPGAGHLRLEESDPVKYREALETVFAQIAAQVTK